MVLIRPAFVATAIGIARLTFVDVVFVPRGPAEWPARVDRARWTLATGDQEHQGFPNLPLRQSGSVRDPGTIAGLPKSCLSEGQRRSHKHTYKNTGKTLSEDCSRASTRKFCPKRGPRKKPRKKPRKRPKHCFSRQKRATKKPRRKSHEKVTSKNATSNEKSSDIRCAQAQRGSGVDFCPGNPNHCVDALWVVPLEGSF